MQIHTAKTYNCKGHENSYTTPNIAYAVSPLLYVNRVNLNLVQTMATVLDLHVDMLA